MEEGINVLSLFDGMSCGRIALERAGIKVNKYFACEIDKYAIQVSKANYPDIMQLGSVTNVIGWELPKIDLLIGGSPCQGFSFAGKQLNFDDPRSKLFFEYVRILEECREENPEIKFMLENVLMKKEYQEVISKALGVNPVIINSALVSAQNRKRLYWTNICEINQPRDKGIILQDILEDIIFSNTSNTHPSGRGMNGKIHSIEGKSPCLTTNKGEGIKIGTFIYGGRCVGRRKNDSGIRCDNDKSFPVKQHLEINSNPNKSNCLTTVGKDNLLIRVGNADVKGHDYNKGVYSVKGKHTCLVSAHERSKIAINTIQYRKATPLECERLQTVSDNYTACVSNSQRYKMLGNGWTVDVIAHIFKYLDELY